MTVRPRWLADAATPGSGFYRRLADL